MMRGERLSLDTNILVYFADADAGARHAKAREIVLQAAGRDTVLPLQALAEFYHTVTRKQMVSPAAARQQVRDWTTIFPVVAAQPSTLDRAMASVEQQGLSFWDAMLWATVREAGVTLLLSEDFQDGGVIEGVRIRNPFR